MHKAICAAFAVMGLLISLGAARAADAATCDVYVKEATAKAQGVRQFDCGFDAGDPRWATARTGHASWCKNADKQTVERESIRRRGDIRICQTCRAYAVLATAVAADNIRLKCGYQGARWSDKAEDHFAWCMQQREPVPVEVTDVSAAYKASLEKLRGPVDSETVVRALQATDCQLTKSQSARRSPKR